MSESLADRIAALFKEWREDYAAAKREDAHYYGAAAAEKAVSQKTLEEEVKAPEAAEKAEDREIER